MSWGGFDVDRFGLEGCAKREFVPYFSIVFHFLPRFDISWTRFIFFSHCALT
jgi:hypothetical protein